MNKRILALLLALTTTFSLVGCSEDETTTSTAPSSNNTSTSASTPTNTENTAPSELTLFLTNKNIVDGSYAMEAIEKETNTVLTLIQTTTAELDNKLNIQLASGDIPDIIQCETETMESQLLDSGILLPLNEHWGNYPNIEASRTPEVWDLMRYTDGNIYSIGISTHNPLAITAYRQDWLDMYDMEVPTTLDEYYEYAKAISLQDPDGNGVDDTFAMGNYKVIDNAWFDHIFGAFGALPNYWMEKDGNIVNGSIDPAMKEALIYLNKMYEEGLIDPEFVTDDAKRWQTKVKAGTYGAGVTKIHIFDENNWSNYYDPFKAAYPDGEMVVGGVLEGGSENPVGIRRASDRGWLRTFIYEGSEEVDGALRLLNYLTSEEGNRFAQYGVEGEHYNWEGDMLVPTIDTTTVNELDLNKFFIGNTVLFDHSSDSLAAAFEHSHTIDLANPVDGIFIEELNDIYPRLKEITNIRYIQMIVGEVPIEGGFEDFVAEWNERGGDELTAALDAAWKAKV